MPRDKLPNQSSREPDLLDKLFGDPAEMADEEINMLYEALAPDTDPAAAVHRIAESAAVPHRVQNRMPPDHIQAALDATRVVKSLDNASPSKLRQIIDTLTGPFTGTVNDPSFAYRNRDGKLNPDDRDIMDDLTDELREDWDDDGDSEHQ
jgi:hypothetical protein